MASAILFVFYAGVFNHINIIVWICIGLIFLELFILLIYKWKCPLTVLGKRYTEDISVGFDIFLPKWLARNNKIIFSILFLVGLGLVLWRVTN